MLSAPERVKNCPVDPHVLAGLIIDSDLIAVALVHGDRVLFANHAFCKLFGRLDGLADLPVEDLVLPEHRDRLGGTSHSISAAAGECVATGLRADGSVFEVELRFGRVSHGNEVMVAVFAQDITQRRRTETQLGLLAYSDPLTGLANRAMFADRLRQAALHSRRTGEGFALLMLDLDGFKAVNDQHGHDAGDRLLQQISQGFSGCLRSTDTIARLGGDEFVVLLPGLSLRANVASVAERLIEAARLRVSIGEHEVRLATSMGIAVFPEHADTVDHLLAAADIALYAAKRQGRGIYAWASPTTIADAGPPPLMWSAAHEVGIAEMDEQHARLAALLNELVDALKNGTDHTAIFREIVRYAEYHFACEERLMAEHDYADSVQHRDAHRRLLDDIRNLGLERDGLSVSLILRYLQEWLLRHIDSNDRDLARALLADGAR